MLAHGVELLAILQSGIFLDGLFGDVNPFAVGHQGRCFPKVINVSFVVTVALFINRLIESGQVFGFNMRAIVLQQRHLHLLVKGCIPLFSVVIKLDVTAFLVLDRRLNGLQCAVSQLVGAQESLVEVHQSLAGFEAISVETGHFPKVELAFQVARRVLPSPDEGFIVLLLSNKTNGIDTLVHAD